MLWTTEIRDVWPQIFQRCMLFFNDFLRFADDLGQHRGGQKWIRRRKDKFIFPGGATHFIHVANQYVDQIFKVFQFYIFSVFNSFVVVSKELYR